MPKKSYKNKELPQWKTQDCAAWLIDVGAAIGLKEKFTEYSNLFEDHHITGKLFPNITQDDLRRVGIRSVGHQKLILDSIRLTIEEKDGENFLIDFSLPSPDQMIGSLVMKLIVTCAYLLFAAFITAFVMVMVQYRVPDQYTYPPLPDIVLDSIPHIPWAFKIAEYILSTLGCIAFTIILFHKERFVKK